MSIFDRYTNRDRDKDIENARELQKELEDEIEALLGMMNIKGPELEKIVQQTLDEMEREGFLERYDGDKYRITQKGNEYVYSLLDENIPKRRTAIKPSDIKIVSDP